MARTDNDIRRTEARRALRREVPGTVALLADERDFAAMAGYSTFPFRDHETYLRAVDGLLRQLAAQGLHTSVALFDPAAFAEFCAEKGLDPDSPDSRTRYTADVAAAAGGCVAYEGQPVAGLVPLLADEAARYDTLEYATSLLAAAGRCPGCGDDVGRAAYARASQALTRLVQAVGTGDHHTVCSVPVDGTPLVAALRSSGMPDGTVRLREADALVFCTVLAVGIATDGPGGVVLRTTGESGHDTVRGWSLRDGWPQPLSEAEVFTAYCTDADTGEPVPPEPGVDYRAGIPLAPPPEPPPA